MSRQSDKQTSGERDGSFRKESKAIVYQLLYMSMHINSLAFDVGLYMCVTAKRDVVFAVLENTATKTGTVTRYDK